MLSNMAVALYMPTPNFAMHPRAGRYQHNHPPLGRFGFSLHVSATMADGVKSLFGGDEWDRCLLAQGHAVFRLRAAHHVADMLLVVGCR